MKKPKQTGPYEDKVDLMRDLNVDIESPDDDSDVIDLEDIIEMPDSPIDEDEDLDLDVGILYEGSDLEPAPGEAEQSIVEQQPQGLGPEEEDLLKLIEEEPEEEEVLFEPAKTGEPGEPTVSGGEPPFFDEDEESFLDEFMEKPPAPGKGMDAEEREAGPAEALKIREQTRIPYVEPEAEISEPTAEAPARASIASAAELSETVEELIGGIESRLEEHIRAEVASRLPDLVRSILLDEIEKLKKELGLTGERIL